MDEVGGDIFDLIKSPQGHLRCLLADATGHGVQGALITMALKSEFESLSPAHNGPGSLLRAMNQNFTEKFHGSVVFFSAVVVDIDSSTGIIRYSSAGHPAQWIVSSKKFRALTKTGPIIGIFPDQVFGESILEFSKDDTLFLFSDGAFEQLASNDHDFGESRLLEVMQQSCEHNKRDRLSIVESALTRAIEETTRCDDITVLAISIQ